MFIESDSFVNNTQIPPTLKSHLPRKPCFVSLFRGESSSRSVQLKHPIRPPTMSKTAQAPVSCMPVGSKTSKAKKVLDEAHEAHARELDLVDKAIVSFDEMPGLCK